TGMGYRPDAGQRLATKPHGADAKQILVTGELAGGVLGEGQGQFFRRDTATIVTDADQLLSAILDLDDDVRGASIDGVLQQLLNHRRGPLDDLTGGNSVYQIGRKLLDYFSLHDCIVRKQAR